MLLTSAAYVHLKHLNVSRHTRNLSPASRAILLTGTAGMLYDSVFNLYKITDFLPDLVSILLEYALYYRNLPANACKSAVTLFWSKVVIVGCAWLLYEGIYSSLKVVCRFSFLTYDYSNSYNGIYLQMQSKYGCSNKEAVSNVPMPIITFLHSVQIFCKPKWIL